MVSCSSISFTLLLSSFPFVDELGTCPFHREITIVVAIFLQHIIILALSDILYYALQFADFWI